MDISQGQTAITNIRVCLNDFCTTDPCIVRGVRMARECFENTHTLNRVSMFPLFLESAKVTRLDVAAENPNQPWIVSGLEILAVVCVGDGSGSFQEPCRVSCACTRRHCDPQQIGCLQHAMNEWQETTHRRAGANFPPRGGPVFFACCLPMRSKFSRSDSQQSRPSGSSWTLFNDPESWKMKRALKIFQTNPTNDEGKFPCWSVTPKVFVRATGDSDLRRAQSPCGPCGAFLLFASSTRLPRLESESSRALWLRALRISSRGAEMCMPAVGAVDGLTHRDAQSWRWRRIGFAAVSLAWCQSVELCYILE